jgi:hypothetical protein
MPRRVRRFLPSLPLGRRRRRDEKGYVLAVSAIIMVPLLAISGMATDIGGWYAEGSKMQKAADAAALAGVVWLPDLSKATAVANETARQNGFDSSKANISIVVGQISNTDLRVSITDTDAPIFFSRFFMSSMTIKRESIATYVLPVPLGSPRNFFGTGNLYTSEPEGMWASINGWCAPKEQGDPFAVGFEGNWPATGQVCPGSTANGQYRANPTSQYEYIISVPAVRALPIVVHLYSPAKTTSSPDNNDGTNMTTTFTLRSPDNTPFDDDDNPITQCTPIVQSNPRAYAPNEVDNDATILGVSGWSAFCTIPTSAVGGNYVLGVRTLQGELGSNGSNQYAVMASYNGTGTACDSRTDATCPTVVGRNWISVLATSTSSNANFYLAEINPIHAGKQMEITLFDPGEGGNYIQILDPNGFPVNFSYRTADGASGLTGSGTQLDVSGCNASMTQIGPNRASNCKFNERFVILTVDLPANYATAYAARWWKINYVFTSAVTDRSTWSVRIIGDPVHISN